MRNANDTYTSFVQRQKAICREYGVEFEPSPRDAIFGFAVSTKAIDQPFNGLRHWAKNGTTGWYIWRGEEPSSADDFFKPMHVSHATEECPEVIDYLGLPPGSRFLIHGDYVDVWYDESLLEGESN